MQVRGAKSMPLSPYSFSEGLGGPLVPDLTLTSLSPDRDINFRIVGKMQRRL